VLFACRYRNAPPRPGDWASELDSSRGRLTARSWRLEGPLRVEIVGLLQQTRNAERPANIVRQRQESAFAAPPRVDALFGLS
jgi:hypothetical protein